MNKIKINGWTIGILLLGIISLIFLLKVVDMQLIYAIPIGIGFPILIMTAIYAISSQTE